MHVCCEIWAIGAGLSIFAFCPQVMQVLNADAIVVKLNSGDYKTIHLSSIRPPRLEGENMQVRIGRQWSLFSKTEGKMLENTYTWYICVRMLKDGIFNFQSIVS